MSFESTLTLKNALDANVTYVRLHDDKNGSLYSRSDAELGQPINLELASTLVAPGSIGNDRLLIKNTRVKSNVTTGKISNAAVNITVSASREFSTAEIMDLIAAGTSFAIEANIVRMRRGEK